MATSFATQSTTADDHRLHRPNLWLVQHSTMPARKPAPMRWTIDDYIEFTGAVLLALVLAALVLAVV